MSDDIADRLRAGASTDAKLHADAITEITTLRARVAVLEEKLKWQPIETAPSDRDFLAGGGYWYPQNSSPTVYKRIAWRSGDEQWPWEDHEGKHPDGFFHCWQELNEDDVPDPPSDDVGQSSPAPH